MTKFMQRSFSVGGNSSDEYRNNYERIFSKTAFQTPLEPLPDPLQRDASGEKTALHVVTLHLPSYDFEALRAWAVYANNRPLDPDVAHTVLMAAADAVVK